LKKVLPLFLILILIISSMFIGITHFDPEFNIVTAETGAPLTNGTTIVTWTVDVGNNVYRSNEVISTVDIIIKGNGMLKWTNVTCTTVGNIIVENQGRLDLVNSVLTLGGNFTIQGTVTLKNTTLKMNPSQNGEFNIKVEGNTAGLQITDLDNDPLTLFDRSHITSAVPDNNHRYMFRVEPNTNFELKNSQLSQCGVNDSVPGLTIRTNQCLVDNSSIFDNYIGLNIETTTLNSIIYSDFTQNSYAGIRIANLSSNNNIINCRFMNNENSIMLDSSSNIKIIGCSFDNSGFADIHLTNSTNNDIKKCNSINSKNGIILTSNSNNNDFDSININFTLADIVVIVDSDNNIFTRCNFTDSGLNGVTLTGSSNNAFTACNLSENSGWGIYIGDNNGKGNLIQYSRIADNLDQGLRIEDSVSRNIITNNDIENNLIGVYYKSASLNEISNCNITKNKNYGIYYFTGARNLILFTNLSHNPVGMYFTFKSRFNFINDSAIYNSSNYDIMIDGSSNLTSVNSNFDRNNNDIEDSSNLTIKWYLKVNVVDFDTSAPLDAAEVKIKDAVHSAYHMNFKTDPTGWTGTILATDIFQDSINVFNYNPQDVRAWKIGYEPKVQTVTIDRSMNLYFSLKERLIPILPDFVITNLTFSNSTPVQGQEFTINATIYNNGTENLTGEEIVVDFYVDNSTLIGTANFTTLTSKTYTDVQTSWVVNVTNGTHLITAVVDVYNFTFELDEANNNMSKNITINTESVARLIVNRSVVLSTELIEFDASNSSDEIFGIVEYYFDYGNGNTSGWINESMVEYGYPNSGVFYAKARVRDSTGLISKWSNVKTINVDNRPPVAGFNYTPEIGYVNTIFQFTPNGSVDVDGVIITYAWDFGEGTTSDEAAPTHTFPDDVTYMISLRVYDNSGANSSLFNKTISIANLPPNAVFSVNKKSVGLDEQIIFDATQTTDLDDNNLTELNYTWDFKDGNFSTGRIVFHNFKNSGDYNVTLRVTDDDLALSQFVIQISVIGEPPSGDGDGDDDVSGWIWAAIGIVVVVIIILIILFLFIIPGKRRGLTAGSQFVTTGKMDFVILKKEGKKTYRKFELHRIATPATASPQAQATPLPAIPLGEDRPGQESSTGEPTPPTTPPLAQALPYQPDYQPPGKITEPGQKTHTGLYWKTGLIDSSWVVYDVVEGEKKSVVTIMNNDINTLMQKKWGLDYAGNGMILRRTEVAKPLPSEPLESQPVSEP
jgi:hypothetical protein